METYNLSRYGSGVTSNWVYPIYIMYFLSIFMLFLILIQLLSFFNDPALR